MISSLFGLLNRRNGRLLLLMEVPGSCPGLVDPVGLNIHWVFFLSGKAYGKKDMF